MKNYLAIAFFIILLIALGFYVGQSCSGNESLTNINQAMAQSDKNLAELKTKMEQIDSSLKAIKVEGNEIKNYYTNKYYEIDSLIRLDSAVVNAIIRAGMERLYRLPGFFEFTIDSNGVGYGSENTSSW